MMSENNCRSFPVPVRVFLNGYEWKWYACDGELVVVSFDGRYTHVGFDLYRRLVEKSGGPKVYSCVKPDDAEHFINTFVEKLYVESTPESIIVMLNDQSKPIGCADMDFMEKWWWLSRIKVYPEYRKRGYGIWLIETLKARANRIPILVEPGGYDLTREEQWAFYEACGFVDQKDGTLVLSTMEQ